jgi:hypothetical protein
LHAKRRWKNLQDEPPIEPDHEIGAGGKEMRLAAWQAMPAGDVDRGRQTLRGIHAPRAETFVVRKGRQAHAIRPAAIACEGRAR